jgi:hypothetical protein
MGNAGRVSDEKTPVEQAIDQALDVFVYAPIGLVFDGPALLPQLIERGKNQVNMARMIGQFATQQGGTEVGKQIAKLQEQAEGWLGLLGLSGTNGKAASSQSTTAAPTTAPAAAAPQSSARSSELAIPDYDSLSASQVVNRLAGLTTAELEAVRDYEAAHRGRKTILNKVAQLQA